MGFCGDLLRDILQKTVQGSYIHIYMYIYIFTHTYIHIYIHIHIVYIYIYILSTILPRPSAWARSTASVRRCPTLSFYKGAFRV